MAAVLNTDGMDELIPLEPQAPRREPRVELAAPAPVKPRRKWQEVQADPRFQALSSEDQEAARAQYFDEVVAPQVDEVELPLARKQFDQDTQPGRIRRTAHDAKQALSGAADVVGGAAMAAKGILDRAADAAGPTIDAGLQAIQPPPVRQLSPETTPGLARSKDTITNRIISEGVNQGLSPIAAAGMAGNFDHETGGFRYMQEIKPTVPGSRGGYGWAQWTGPRRDEFLRFAKDNNLSPSSPEANLGYAFKELREGKHVPPDLLKRMNAAKTPEEAARLFRAEFERPGVVADDSRAKRAVEALSIWQSQQGRPESKADWTPEQARTLPQELYGLPLQKGYIDTVRAKWDAAGPGERARMLTSDSEAEARVARFLRDGYAQADRFNDPALSLLDGRREKREEAYRFSGADPESARRWADTDLKLGIDRRKDEALSRSMRPGYFDMLADEFKRGLINLGANAGDQAAFALDVAGADQAAKGLLESMKLMKAEAEALAGPVQDFAQINTDQPKYLLDDATRYVGSMILSNLPMMLPSIGTGVLGGVVAQKAAQTAAKALVESVGPEAAAKYVMAKVAQGAALGAGASAVGLETGSIYGDIYGETGQMRPGVAAAGGVLAGALDAIPAWRAATKLIGAAAASQVAGTVLKRLGREAGIQFLAEGGTEFVQTLIERGAVHVVDGTPLVNDADVHEAINAAIAGGLTGGAMGGLSQGAAELRRPPSKAGALASELQAAIDKAKLPMADANTGETITDGQAATRRMDPFSQGQPWEAPKTPGREAWESQARRMAAGGVKSAAERDRAASTRIAFGDQPMDGQAAGSAWPSPMDARVAGAEWPEPKRAEQNREVNDGGNQDESAGADVPGTVGRAPAVEGSGTGAGGGAGLARRGVTGERADGDAGAGPDTAGQGAGVVEPRSALDRDTSLETKQGALLTGEKRSWPKKPEQWTKDEYVAWWEKTSPPPTHRDAEPRHERIVIDALRAGKHVPDEVLKDYPEIDAEAERGYEKRALAESKAREAVRKQYIEDFKSQYTEADIRNAITSKKDWQYGRGEAIQVKGVRYKEFPFELDGVSYVAKMPLSGVGETTVYKKARGLEGIAVTYDTASLLNTGKTTKPYAHIDALSKYMEDVAAKNGTPLKTIGAARQAANKLKNGGQYGIVRFGDGYALRKIEHIQGDFNKEAATSASHQDKAVIEVITSPGLDQQEKQEEKAPEAKADAKPEKPIEIPDAVKRALDFHISGFQGAAQKLRDARSADAQFGGGGRYASEVWDNAKLEDSLKVARTELETLLGSFDPPNRAAAQAYIDERMPKPDEITLTRQEREFFGKGKADAGSRDDAETDFGITEQAEKSPLKTRSQQIAQSIREIKEQKVRDREEDEAANPDIRRFREWLSNAPAYARKAFLQATQLFDAASMAEFRPGQLYDRGYDKDQVHALARVWLKYPDRNWGLEHATTQPDDEVVYGARWDALYDSGRRNIILSAQSPTFGHALIRHERMPWSKIRKPEDRAVLIKAMKADERAQGGKPTEASAPPRDIVDGNKMVDSPRAPRPSPQEDEGAKDQRHYPPTFEYFVKVVANNAADLKPLPGKRFTPEQSEVLAEWLRGMGYTVRTPSIELDGGKYLRVYAEGDARVQRLLSGKDARQWQAAERQNREMAEQSAREKQEWQQTFAESPAREWIEARFGDMGALGKAQLARYLDGRDKKLGLFMLSRADHANLQKLGLAQPLPAGWEKTLKQQYEGGDKTQAATPEEAPVVEAPPVVQDSAAVAADSTHTDPGETPEPTTPGVMGDAIRVGASAKSMSRKEMLAYLQGRVKALLPGAYDDTQDRYPFFDQNHKRFIIKQPKKYGGNLSRKDEDVIESSTGRRHVIIDVPGDGKFKILNTVSALTSFQRLAEKSAGFSDAKRKPSVPRDSDSGLPTLEQMVKDQEWDNAWELAKLGGKRVVLYEEYGEPKAVWDAQPVEGHPDWFLGYQYYGDGKRWVGVEASSSFVYEVEGVDTREQAHKTLAKIITTFSPKDTEYVQSAAARMREKYGEDVQAALRPLYERSIGLVEDENAPETSATQRDDETAANKKSDADFTQKSRPVSLYSLGSMVSLALPLGSSSLKPSKAQIQHAAEQLGITPSDAARALATYNDVDGGIRAAGRRTVDVPWREGDTKTENGIEYRLTNGQWHDITQETRAEPTAPRGAAAGSSSGPEENAAVQADRGEAVAADIPAALRQRVDESKGPAMLMRGSNASDEADYTLYEKGRRLHLKKDGTVVQGEASGGDVVRIALRNRTEADIVYANQAAREAMEKDRQAIEAERKKQADERAERDAQDAKERALRAALEERLKGAKFTKTAFVPMVGGYAEERKELAGVGIGELVVHKSIVGHSKTGQLYDISHGPTGLLVVKGFTSQTAAKQAAARLDAAGLRGFKTAEEAILNADQYKQAGQIAAAIKRNKMDALASPELDAVEPEAAAPAEVKPVEPAAAVTAADEPTTPERFRDPTKVSVFSPYEDGDNVKLGEQTWTVRNGDKGWYLTSDGTWRGTHPTVKDVAAMVDLIRAVEQAQVQAEQPAQTAVEAKAEPTPKRRVSQKGKGEASVDVQAEAGQWELQRYEERKTNTEGQAANGEIVTRRVGDWGNAETSAGSGRGIVNVYWLKHKQTGEVRPFGSDTAYQAMGLDKETAQRKATQLLNEQRDYNVNKIRHFTMAFDQSGQLKPADSQMIERTLEDYAKGRIPLDDVLTAVQAKIGRTPLPARLWIDEKPSPSPDMGDKSAKAEPATTPPAASTTGDAGAELTANKRNRLRNGIQWEDIKDQTESLRVKQTTKANVYPKPDYAALVEDVDPAVAYLVKHVYDNIATTPAKRAPTDADLQAYIAGVRRVMAVTLDWVRRAQYENAFRVTAEGQTLLQVLYPHGWTHATADEKTEITLLGGSKFFKAIQPGYDERARANREIKKGWPVQQEAWQKQGYRIISREQASLHVPNPKAELFVVRVAETYHSDHPTREEAQAVIDGFAPWLVLNKLGRVVAQQDTQEAAINAARDAAKRKGADTTVSDKGISVTAAVREGPAYRQPGEDISSERLLETFGFKGVNFGNWMQGKSNDAERQLHLNHAYDAMLDLAQVLNVPPRAMSLNGMLGLAIGAQGNGKYAAHFVPGVNEINLTRTSGAGSLAHEFAHALDHYFANQAGLARSENPFMTAYVRPGTANADAAMGELRPEIKARFKAIHAAMTKRVMTPEEAEAERVANMQQARTHLARWIKSFDANTKLRDDAEYAGLMERIQNLDLGEGVVPLGKHYYVSPVVDELVKVVRAKHGSYPLDQFYGLFHAAKFAKGLNDEAEAAGTHKPQAVKTDYQRAADKLDSDKGGKPYWSTPWELFARAFDAYVSDRMADQSQRNTYLSHAGRSGETVPSGTERTAINAAFDGLVQAIQTRETDGGVAMFSRRAQREVNVTVRVAGNPLAVVKNPTFARAMAVAEKDPYGEIRLVRNPETGDVFIAGAASTLHENIADVAGIPYDSRNPQGVWRDNSWGENLQIIKAKHIYSGVYDRYFAESAGDVEFSRRVLPETLTVDGVERPTRNSEGRVIHPTEEGVRNFWRWFGDSKVVDGQGRPLVVYHGTKNDFSVFEQKTGTVATIFGSEPVDRHGFFFTANKSFAGVFSEGREPMALYIRAKNPLDMFEGINGDDADKLSAAGFNDNLFYSGIDQWELFDEETGADFTKSLRSSGFDGVWIAEPDDNGKTVRVFVALDKSQIKSATGNTGAFSPENDDIRYARKGAGAEGYTPDGVRAVIDGSEGKGFAAALEKTGWFHIITGDQVPEDVRAQAGGDRIPAYAWKGEVYFVADEIHAGDSIPGLLRHEVAVHAMRLNKSDAEFRAILQAMRRLPGEKAARARAAVPKQTPGHLRDEEALAYFIEQNPTHSLTRRFLAWLRSAIRALARRLPGVERGRWLRWAHDLSEDELIAMANSALRAAVRGDGALTGEQVSKFALRADRAAQGANGVALPWATPQQEVSSAATSINDKLLPGTFTNSAFLKAVMQAIERNNGSIRIGDIGGGKFDNAANLFERREIPPVNDKAAESYKAVADSLGNATVKFLVYDPFNRSATHNQNVRQQLQGGQADIVTSNNVANVIGQYDARRGLYATMADALKPDGVAFLKLYAGTTDVGTLTRTRDKQTGEVTESWQNNAPALNYAAEVAEFFDSVKAAGDILILQGPRPSVSGYVPVERDWSVDTGKMVNGAPVLQNYSGSKLQRGGSFPKHNEVYPVGKWIGGQLYLHKDYLSTLPTKAQTLYREGVKRLPSGFTFNTLVWEPAPKSGVARIRFDEAPDFDTANEPIPGRQFSYFEDGSTAEAYSAQIWHHKWQWVGNDYRGFDVGQSIDWSRTYLSRLEGVPNGRRDIWERQLDAVGLGNGQVAKFSRRALPETISVDGVERPTRNSEGRPIHPTEAGVRNFWRWFAGSRVVDEQGRPVVVYKGGPTENWRDGSPIKEFKSPNGPWAGFFTNSADVANKFAEAQFGMTKHGGAPAGVFPVYLNLSNPLVIDAGDKLARDFQIDASVVGAGDSSVRERLLSGQYDGLVLSDTQDEGTVYVTLQSTQAKSAIGNTGAFSPTDPDIRFSRRAAEPKKPHERLYSAADPVGVAEKELQQIDAAVAGAGGWGAALKRLDGRGEDSFRKLGAKARREILGALTVHQLVDVGGSVLPRMREYLTEMSAMDATRNRLIHESDALAKRWGALPKKEIARVGYVMHESTIAGVDGSDEEYIPSIDIKEAKQKIKTLQARQFGAGGDKQIAQWQAEVNELKARIQFELNRRKEWHRVKGLYEALSTEGQAVYRAVRDYHSDHLNRVQDALVQMIEKTRMTGKQKYAAIQQLKEEFELLRVQAPYFPLGRFGDYWVHVAEETDPRTGNVIRERIFEKFETREEADAFYQEQVTAGRQVARGKQLENLREVTGVSATFVAQVEDLIGELGAENPEVADLRDQVYQLYLKTLPEVSSRKHAIHRGKVAGYAKDALRVFANKAFHDAYQYARIKHGFELREIMEQLQADVAAAGSAAKVAEMAARRALLEGFRDEVLAKKMTFRATKERAVVLDAQAAEIMASAKKRRLTEGEQFVIDEASRWNQYAAWFGEWHKKRKPKAMEIKRMTEAQLERELSALDLREQTIAAIQAHPTGHEFAPDLLNELQKAYQWLMNPTTGRVASMLNALGFGFHLAVSPAAWVTNATQTPLIAMPYVAATRGLVKTHKAFQAALGEAMRSSWRWNPHKEHRFGIREALIKQDEIDAYNQALDRGLVDRGRVMDLIGLAEEGADRLGGWQKFGTLMALGFHEAERVNREVTFMAAYRLARDAGESFMDAVDYADKVVNETHFNYSAENRSRWMRSDAARVLLQFKSYAQHVTYLQWKMVRASLGQAPTPEAKAAARKFLMVQTAVQLAAGGVMGLPLGVWATMGAVAPGLAAAKRWGYKGALLYTFALMGAAVGLGGDDPDDPVDWWAEFEQAMADALGATGGQAVGRGLVNAVGGIDLSSRVSMRELWWREIGKDIEERSFVSDVLTQAAGPSIGVLVDIGEGVTLAAQGQTYRGIERMTPKMIRDGMQAVRFFDEGALTLKGDPLIEELTPLEILARASGFTPSRLTARYAENQAEKQRESRIEARRQRVQQDIAEAGLARRKAEAAGEEEQAAEAEDRLTAALERAKRYNQKQPQYPITPDSLSRSVKGRLRARMLAKDGVFMNKRIPERYEFAPKE